ncbi:MAG TPA: 30S ribosomal protein S4 [Thermotogota bacterium]|nr:30S ribosomal protein S4 [Thermotogota bacterium]HRW91349.1 30S ribosomal protein S4 [Thermotogota bacterium]
MARYTGPSCKLCRREGKKLYLKGDRCTANSDKGKPKCAFDRRPQVPGQHGKSGPSKISQYGLQLRAKQSMKRTYGVLEKQFRKYFEEARRREGVTGENLVRITESRLDNVFFRAGFCDSRGQARQLISHGHVLVNGRKVNIPSYRVRKEDIVEVSEKSRGIVPIKAAVDKAKQRGTPPWMEVDFDAFKAMLIRFPDLEETGLQVDVQSIVELYSK